MGILSLKLEKYRRYSLAKIKIHNSGENMILRKPNQFATSNITGLNRFQHEVLDILSYNSQLNYSMNNCKKTPMGRLLFNINISDIMDKVSDRKDMKSMNDVWNLINQIKDIRHRSKDGFYGSVVDITIFPYIKINTENGEIEYTLEDNIEYALLNGGIIGDGNNKIKPKGYYTPIEINQNLSFKNKELPNNKKIPLRAIGLFQFITRYTYLLEKHNKYILELEEEEFRFCTGISSINCIGDRHIEDYKYKTTSELKRFARFLEKDMKYFYDLEMVIKIKKGIQNSIKNISIIINRSCDGYDRLNEYILELESIIKNNGENIK